MSLNRKPEINIMDIMFCLPKEEGGHNQSKIAGVVHGEYCFARIDNILLKIPGKEMSITSTEQLIDGIAVTKNDPRAIKTWPLTPDGDILDQSKTLLKNLSYKEISQKLAASKETMLPKVSDSKTPTTDTPSANSASVVGLNITSGVHDYSNQTLNVIAPPGKSVTGLCVSNGVVNFKGGKISAFAGQYTPTPSVVKPK